MRNYIRKAAFGLREVFGEVRSHGWRRGLVSMGNVLWKRSSSVLYRRTTVSEDIPVPEGVRIVRVDPDRPDVPLGDILAAGAGSDVRYLKQGATCYLAYLDDAPVSLGWAFPGSYLLRRARLERDAMYLGGFHTIEAARGRGLYPLLLKFMCANQGVQERICYVDAEPDNHASLRGIEKAGFHKVGFLKAHVLAGIILRCRIVTDRSSQAGCATTGPPR